MRKLFLSSSFSDVADLLPSFLNGIELRGKKVSFIPTGSLRERVTFYVEAGKKALEKLGLEVEVIEVSQMPQAEVLKHLECNDMIYISGGNTFYLLQELKRKGADLKIAELINKGKPYIGESAGSAILAPNVAYMQGLDSPDEAPELDTFKGLDVIDVYPLPHHTNYPFKKAVEQVLANNSALNLLPFSNKQVICITGSEMMLQDK